MSAVFGTIGSAMNIASVWTVSDDGSRELLEVEGEADEIGQTLEGVQADAQVGLARLEQIIVSGYGKLQATSQYFEELNLQAGSGDNYDALWKMLAVAGRQTIYNTLLPQNAGPQPGTPTFSNVFEWLHHFDGDPGSLTPRYCTLSMFPPLPSTVAAALFAAPTFADGDINGGISPQVWYLQRPFQTGSSGCF